MNSLIPTRKNGRLSRNHGLGTFPTFSTLIDDLFNDSFINEGFNDKQAVVPAINIKEVEDTFVIELAAPGNIKDDFKLDVDHDVMHISVDRTAKDEETKDHYTRREFSFQSFKRSFNLPETVDTDKIEASYINGVLAVTLPKREEAKRKPARTINIE